MNPTDGSRYVSVTHFYTTLGTTIVIILTAVWFVMDRYFDASIVMRDQYSERFISDIEQLDLRIKNNAENIRSAMLVNAIDGEPDDAKP